MRKWLLLYLILFTVLQAQAFEDYLVMTQGKLTDISIEDNTIVDVYPLITLMNDKNTLMVSPMKIGKTRVCVLKNGKEKILFNVEVRENKTIIDEVNGFEILSLDSPDGGGFELDEPPMLKEVQ